MSKEGLVHIKTHSIDGEELDISDSKIYLDTPSGQYKHRFVCSCGKKLGCYCFESVDAALEGIEIGIACEECSIAGFLSDTIGDDENLQKMIDESQHTILQPLREVMNAIENGIVFSDADNDFRDKILSGLEEEIDKMEQEVIGSLFSDNTKKKLMSYMMDCDYFDGGWPGSSCSA
jgi:hypothetical protein